jgi:actin-related protein 10
MAAKRATSDADLKRPSAMLAPPAGAASLAPPSPEQPPGHLRAASTLVQSSYRRTSTYMTMKAQHSAVVLDIGETHTKCGFSGEHGPRVVFANGWRMASSSPWPADQSTEEVVSFGAGNGAGGTSLSERDWMRVLWPYVNTLYFRHLLVSPKDRKVVVCENPFLPQAFKNALVRSLFKLGVPGVLFLFGPQLPSLAYASGGARGVVVDIGVSETRVLPVLDNYAVREALVVVPIGVRDVLNELRRLVSAAEQKESHAAAPAPKAASSLGFDAVVRCCFVRRFPSENALPLPRLEGAEAKVSPGAHLAVVAPKPTPAAIDARYPLPPPAAPVLIPGAARAMACDVLFDPRSEKEASLQGAVLTALRKCASDARVELAGSLMLCGGGARLPGLGDRLLDELNNALLARECAPLWALQGRFGIAQSAFDSTIQAWVGASLLGSQDLRAELFLTEKTLEQLQGEVLDWTFPGGLPDVDDDQTF